MLNYFDHLLLLLGRIAVLRRSMQPTVTDRQRVCRSLCRELCRNCWTEQDTVWV